MALDVFAANVDRTARNPNLLWHGGELWLIDHGASLYLAPRLGRRARRRRAWRRRRRARSRAGDHVLLPLADELPAAGAALAAALDDA